MSHHLTRFIVLIKKCVWYKSGFSPGFVLAVLGILDQSENFAKVAQLKQDLCINALLCILEH